jgi:hypothetical protein
VDEAVAAVAGVLDAAVPLAHPMHAMSEESAGVADSLLESIPRAVRVRVERKQQRMTALDAPVFGVTVPNANRFIGMVAEEARQRVADAHWGRVVAKNRLSTACAGAAFRDELAVINRVAPDETDQTRRHSHLLPAKV